MTAPDIHAVLLVPTEGDPLGLLAEGPCGARPPRVAFRRAHGAVVEARHIRCNRERPRGWSLGLPLWWDGETLAAGCDWAQEAVLGRDGAPHWFRSAAEALTTTDPDLRGWLQPYADQMLADRCWTVVLLDADGREVAL